MKKFIAGLVMTLLFVAGNVLAAAEVVDKTLAVVNGEPIFTSEFNSIFLPIFEQYKQNIPASGQTAQKENELKDAVLNQKIGEVLLKQEVKKQKIKVSKKELQDEMNELKKRFTNDSEFAAELKKENITMADFEKKLSDRIAIMKLAKQSVGSKVKTPSEIEAKYFYDKIIIKMKDGKTNLSKEDDLLVENMAKAIKRASEEQVRLRQVFISCPKGASAAEVKAVQDKVAVVKRELQKQTFADVAAQYSEDPVSKPRNGDLGVVVKGDLDPPAINKTAFSMNVGDHTKEPIKTDTGYYFLKVEEKRAKRNITFEDVKNEIVEVLYQGNAGQAYTDYINSLKSKSNIKVNKTW